MLLAKHRRFLGYEIDTTCFIQPLLRVVEVITTPMLVYQLAIVGEADVEAAGNDFMSAVDRFGARWKRILRDALLGLCHTLPFPAHSITLFLLNRFADCFSYEMGKAVP